MAALLACDYWYCSCCFQLIDSAKELPSFVFLNGDYQCFRCVVVEQENDISQGGLDNAMCPGKS